ncbi:hypothetical protein L1856_02745 [Streptomyces sp. Tue 6430]|nr:hypothetical protein [Streptomyces sp. Tue 6430]
MTDGFHIGDNVTQYGDHNTGVVHHHSAEEAVSRLQAAVLLLRPHLSEHELPIVDAGMQTVVADGNADPGRVRLALTSIAGVASVVGGVGVPVVDAVRAVLQTLGH